VYRTLASAIKKIQLKWPRHSGIKVRQSVKLTFQSHNDLHLEAIKAYPNDSPALAPNPLAPPESKAKTKSKAKTNFNATRPNNIKTKVNQKKEEENKYFSANV